MGKTTGTPKDHPASEWEEGGSADNAQASVTRAGEAEKRHFIDLIDVSYGASGTSGLLEVLIGGTVVYQRNIHGDLVIPFPKPHAAGVNEDVTVRLEASGTGGELGHVNLFGHTN